MSGSEVRSADGTRVTPGAVIWATGFVLDHSFVQLPVFDTGGRLAHRRGVTASLGLYFLGLYFLGLPWQHTRGSALLVGFVLRPEVGAISMAGSSIIVALNAVALKRLRLPERAGPAGSADA